MSVPVAAPAAPAPLGVTLHAELHQALHAQPGLRALWLGLDSGVTLASAGSTTARHRLTRAVPGLLAAYPRGPDGVLPGGGRGAVAMFRVDGQGWLLALAPRPALAPPGLAALQATARRLAGRLDAWALAFQLPEDAA